MPRLHHDRGGAQRRLNQGQCNAPESGYIAPCLPAPGGNGAPTGGVRRFREPVTGLFSVALCSALRPVRHSFSDGGSFSRALSTKENGDQEGSRHTNTKIRRKVAVNGGAEPALSAAEWVPYLPW